MNPFEWVKLIVQGLGYIRDLVDPRDRLLQEAELSRDLPREVLPRHGLEPRDQAGQSCTGSIVLAYQISEVLKGRNCPGLSAQYNYRGARFLGGLLNRDGGATLRDAAKALVKYGAPPEELFPDTLLNVYRAPSLAASKAAFKIRGIRGYYRIPEGDTNGVRVAIANDAPVIAGWDVDAAFLARRGRSLIDAVNDAIVGKHASILDSYYQDGSYGLLNSWGKTWRDNGRVRVTENFVGKAFDLWAIVT